MKRFGRLNIVIACDVRYCAECGAPELEDGCSNPSCWRARSNSKFPISLALKQLAIEKNFPSGIERKSFIHRYFHSLRRLNQSPGYSRAINAEQHV
jgi:hypothetical protein